MSGVLFCQTQAWSLSLCGTSFCWCTASKPLAREHALENRGARCENYWMSLDDFVAYLAMNHAESLVCVCVCSEKTYMQLAQEWSHQTPNIWQVFFRFFIQAQSRSINAPWAQHPPYFRFATSPVTWSSPTLAAPTAGIASVTLRNAPDSSRTLACKDSQTSCWPLAWSMGCTSAVWSKLWGNIAIPSEGY